MTTTELIKILKDNEFGGASGRPREINFYINSKHYILEPEIIVDSTGDGLFTEITLNLKTGKEFKLLDYTSWSKYEKGIYCVECGKTFDDKEFLKYIKYFKHCPNCGRKVQQKEELV